jgi:tRNA1(Val) A37 N6-methylase TrmN6
MKKQRLPRGWTQQRIRELAEHHERLSEEEQAEEIEISMSQRGQTVMVVPTRLVPKILELMAPKRTA